MATHDVIRQDKSTNDDDLITEAHALEILKNYYIDPREALDVATREFPAFTPYANYWRA